VLSIATVFRNQILEGLEVFRVFRIIRALKEYPERTATLRTLDGDCASEKTIPVRTKKRLKPLNRDGFVKSDSQQSRHGKSPVAASSATMSLHQFGAVVVAPLVCTVALDLPACSAV
jgi:hypothetical protein